MPETIITLNTLIPLGLVITIVGGVAWLTTMHNKVREITSVLANMTSQSDRITKLETEVVAFKETFYEIKDDIKRMQQCLNDIRTSVQDYIAKQKS